MPPWLYCRTFCFVLPLTVSAFYLQVSCAIVNKWNDLCLLRHILPVSLQCCSKLSYSPRILGPVEHLVHMTEGVISWLSQREWMSQQQGCGCLDSLGLVTRNIRALNYYGRSCSQRQRHYPLYCQTWDLVWDPDPFWDLESDSLALHHPLQWPQASCGQRALGPSLQQPRRWAFPLYSISMNLKLKTPT